MSLAAAAVPRTVLESGYLQIVSRLLLALWKTQRSLPPTNTANP